MDHNPFISRNNDLFTMLIMGMIFHIFNLYVFPINVQTQFLIILVFSFLSGLFMSFLYQCLEWALFFVLGIQIVTLAPTIKLLALGVKFNPYETIGLVLQTSQYSLFLLSSWIIGIPTGFLLQKLIMADYYKKRYFF
jgi:hypothetical protein